MHPGGDKAQQLDSRGAAGGNRGETVRETVVDTSGGHKGRGVTKGGNWQGLASVWGDKEEAGDTEVATGRSGC